MSPILLVLLGQAVNILLKAVIKKPELDIDVSGVIKEIIPVLSQVAGETKEETDARRKKAEEVFDKYKNLPQ